MLKQSKVDKMNEAVANLITKRVKVLDPVMATHDELSTLAELVKAVNGAPSLVSMISEPIKPFQQE
ncbi:hypothetical protein ABNX05_14985 [Lysinibacillus sp. M3]|uniref:Uncharacterized protein n=1 Tax=Lysinibacillus zambalensis TaxID=3160866 RepID=A0ABV1MTV0_9BACI